MEVYQVQAEKLIRRYTSTSSQRERGKGKSERRRREGREGANTFRHGLAHARVQT